MLWTLVPRAGRRGPVRRRPAPRAAPAGAGGLAGRRAEGRGVGVIDLSATACLALASTRGELSVVSVLGVDVPGRDGRAGRAGPARAPEPRRRAPGSWRRWPASRWWRRADGRPSPLQLLPALLSHGALRAARRGRSRARRGRCRAGGRRASTAARCSSRSPSPRRWASSPTSCSGRTWSSTSLHRRPRRAAARARAHRPGARAGAAHPRASTRLRVLGPPARRAAAVGAEPRRSGTSRRCTRRRSRTTSSTRSSTCCSSSPARNVWMALFGPLPKPAWFGNGGEGWATSSRVRLFGARAGQRPAVRRRRRSTTSTRRARPRTGIDPTDDQTTAGAIMMVEESMLTICLFGVAVPEGRARGRRAPGAAGPRRRARRRAQRRARGAGRGRRARRRAAPAHRACRA